MLYTARDKRIHVDEFQARGARVQVSVRSRRTVLSVPQEGLDDLGGDLAFGPDGSLYVSFGQGNHPDRSQDLGVLTGKIVRINP